MGKKAKQEKRLLGTYALPDGQRAFGELQLARAETSLQLRYERSLSSPRIGSTLHGELHDLKKISCIRCVDYEEATRIGGSSTVVYSRVVFPHFVFLGSRHFDPAEDRIAWLQFEVGDLGCIFDDYDAFGRVYGKPEEVKKLIPQIVGSRPVPIGPAPRVGYFAGRELLCEVELPFGRFTVRHLPGKEKFPSKSIVISSRLVVNLDFDEVMPFDECLSKVTELSWFLSVLAGRGQGINKLHVRVDTPKGANDHHAYLRVLWPLRPREQAGAMGRRYKPASIDIPLDPIRRPDEFANVLQAWYSRFPSWKSARGRWDECLREGNVYSVNRLVAAANLFDLLPEHIFPPEPPVPSDLATAIKEAIELLRNVPSSDERNSALSALGRIGQPSLTKRVTYCARAIQRRFAGRLSRLEEIVRLAVKCRNYYVHGSDKGFDVDAVTRQKAFLTETLEFIFSIHDLLESGWAVTEWMHRPHTSHHWFTRYLADYESNCEKLLGPVSPPPSLPTSTVPSA
jgi:ApeA N-terminal domain 1